MGKTILTESNVEIPAGVDVTVRAGHIIVKGNLGTLKKKLPNAQVLYKKKELNNKKVINVRMFQAGKKRRSCVSSIKAYINNCIKGVTVGYEFKLRYGFNILTSNPMAIENGKAFQIANFMGQKDVHVIKCPEGVTVENHKDAKQKVIYCRGIDIENVGKMASMMSQKCIAKNLDLRVFRDGIYIESKGPMVKEAEDE